MTYREEQIILKRIEQLENQMNELKLIISNEVQTANK